MEITLPAIEEYCKNHSSEENSIHQALVLATQKFAPQAAHMQVGKLEGQLITLVTKLMQAKNVLEFGTFTGYSALSFAMGLPKEGRVTTLDCDPRAVELAKSFWNQSEHGDKIESILGDAKKSIQKLEAEIQSGTRPLFDLAFIDADKGSYPVYWEACFKLLRKGGAILVDNVLWSGGVLNPEDKSDHTIHAFNEMVKNDIRVEKVMLPVRDGITLAVIIA